MQSDQQNLRDSLIRSLRAAPLLIAAEEKLHSLQPADQQRLRQTMGDLLAASPGMSEFDRLGFGRPNEEIIDRFRAAMQRAVGGGANLADAEKEILGALGMQKIGEFRSTMQSHLAGPAEIPDQDLAIYVPGAIGLEERFRRALAEQIEAAEREAGPRAQPPTEPATEPEADAVAEAEAEADLVAEPEVEANFVEAPSLPSLETAPAVDATPLLIEVPAESEEPGPPEQVMQQVIQSIGTRLEGLNPLPMLTAALEAIGMGGDQFGFLLRYGRYAPEGRKSEFLVGGLGLAELSKRLTTWLEAQGPLDGQVQVIDEGSGELTIYLLGQEAT